MARQQFRGTVDSLNKLEKEPDKNFSKFKTARKNKKGKLKKASKAFYLLMKNAMQQHKLGTGRLESSLSGTWGSW